MAHESERFTRSFLAKWGIELEELQDHAPPIAEGECLAIMGSIVEGLANEESDIDLLYLGQAPLTNKVVLATEGMCLGVSHDTGGREINIERVGLVELEDMRRRVEGSLNTLRSARDATGVYVERSAGRLRMLHRIKTALPLVNAPVLRRWQEDLQLDVFHEFVCLSHVQDVLNLREDLVGEIDAGNLDSAAWMAKANFAPALAAAMLASIGETNAHTKWHHRLLSRHAEVLGQSRVEQVLQLFFMPLAELKEDIIAHVLAASEPAVDDIFTRQRGVRRAVLAFSHNVRYTDPRQPERWKRGGGAQSA